MTTDSDQPPIIIVEEEANDWQRIPPPPAALVAAFRDIIGAGREATRNLLWPEGGSDDGQ